MAKNKSKSHAIKQKFNPPTRVPNNNMVTMEALRKAYDKEMLQASNNTFNLVASSMLVAAHDMGMTKEDVKELLARCFGILDDVAENLATIDSVMALVHGWGIEIYKTADERTQASGRIIEKKTTVFYLLEQGYTEIEEILTKCKLHNIDIDYRDACAYRWEFNKKKYYDTLEVDMSKKADIFERLEQGATNQDIVNEFGISNAGASQYRYIWKKESEGDDMNKNKAKAFGLIEKGADVQELTKEMGITEAAALRYVESYKEEKTGGEIIVMTENMKKAFELFDKAEPNTNVEKFLKLSKAVIHNYRQEWIRVNKRDLNSEEMAEILAEETQADVVILRHKGVLPKKNEVKEDVKPNKKHSIPKDNMEEVKQEEKEIMVKQEPIKEKGIAPNPAFEEAVKDMFNSVPRGTSKIVEKEEVKTMAESKKSLKRVVKVIEIQGEFTTYKPSGPNSFDLEVDGQVITLSREQMKEFGEELLAVAEEEI